MPRAPDSYQVRSGGGIPQLQFAATKPAFAAPSPGGRRNAQSDRGAPRRRPRRGGMRFQREDEHEDLRAAEAVRQGDRPGCDGAQDHAQRR